MKKFLILLTTLIFLCFPVLANSIDKCINDANFELKSTVGVYVQNVRSDDVVYKKNEQKLLNPASTLKLLTFGSAYKVLGENFDFETALYKDANNNIYLRLAGDTLLGQDDLNELFSKLKINFDTTKINNIYIDDSIIDKIPYPKGWMEEDTWPNQRAITPYIIDKNLVQIAIKRSSFATKVDIIQNDDYKIPVINELKLADKQKIEIKRLYGENSSIVNFQGTVSEDEIINLPVLNPEINFNIKVQKAINKNKIQYFKKITPKKMPSNVRKLASVSHNIKDISKDILYNSDNFCAEVVFKIAAAKYIGYKKSASFDDAVKMFNDTYADYITEGIVITDGSGVSRYNLLNPEFIVKSFTMLLNQTNIKDLMVGADEGTMKDRLILLRDNLKVKTGTLSNMSSIVGVLTTRKNKDLVFSIIVQNSPKRKAVLKNFEDTLIALLYRKY